MRKKDMEQNEIRVGNWLNDPRPFNEDTKKFFKMTDNGYFKAKARDIEVAELFEPIQLTKEILLKCGFQRKQDEIVEYVEVMYCHPLYLRFMANNWTLFISESGGYFHTIKYLHQLQNLYFSLTGQELEINL